MGKKAANVNNTPTLPLDNYRKQLGKQENKVIRSRTKEAKQKKAAKSNADKFRSCLIAFAICLALLFAAYLVVSLWNTPLAASS